MEKDVRETLSSIISNTISEKGLTLNFIAKQSGLARTTIKHIIENPEYKPNPKTLCLLSYVLELDYYHLLYLRSKQMK